ncbi:MAG: ABC transporter ATP-binding protein [Solirubrobacteraceae bacterium]|nr:ABC transporter ATP-binding protein [Solirubrobacteraceae bacterium]
MRRTPTGEPWPHDEFPFSVPALQQLDGLSLAAPVTLLAGENGTGKSTIVELIADAMAFGPEGGELVRSGELPPRPRPVLRDSLRPVLSAAMPAGGYFLRAESFYNIAEFIDGGSTFAPDLSLYGGVGLHEQSHGQSFLALAANRFGPRGFYLLDEPEAALSVSGCLALLAVITRAARAGAQFIVATHSPILLACPGATIYELHEGGITPCAWDALDVVRDTRAFLDAPDRFIDAALAEVDDGDLSRRDGVDPG